MKCLIWISGVLIWTYGVLSDLVVSISFGSLYSSMSFFKDI